MHMPFPCHPSDVTVNPRALVDLENARPTNTVDSTHQTDTTSPTKSQHHLENADLAPAYKQLPRSHAQNMITNDS